MKTVTFMAALAATLSLAACATPPGRIKAAAYAPTNCPRDAEGQLKALTAAQQATANNDALGVFLIGLPLGSMSGGDNEAEIARLKACVERRGPRNVS
jgi:hypothetical protein